MDDDAASFFGPPPSPYYDAAEAIQSGKPIGGASLAAIGPDIDRRFQEGDFTLLNFAWRVGNVEAIEQLIDRVSDWRQPSMTLGPMAKQDLLYQVQTDGSPKAAATLAVLLRHGLDPNMREPYGDHAPILLAPVSLHNGAVFKMLAQAGADPWARTQGKFDRSDAIETALDSGEQDFVISLVAGGAFDHRPPSDVHAVLEALARKPRDQAPEWQDNQRVARAIVDRLRLTPSPDVKSLLDKRS